MSSKPTIAFFRVKSRQKIKKKRRRIIFKYLFKQEDEKGEL
jgi:hypothetical protein